MKMFDTKGDIVVIGAGGHAKVIIGALQANDRSIGAIFDDDSSLFSVPSLPD
jgi:shikimate 5-dehydrogenase